MTTVKPAMKYAEWVMSTLPESQDEWFFCSFDKSVPIYSAMRTIIIIVTWLQNEGSWLSGVCRQIGLRCGKGL